MKIGNKDTQYNVSKKNHATITQRYKCLLHAKLGNQPYPDYINVSYMLSLVINHIQMIYIDYYMAFFIFSSSSITIYMYLILAKMTKHFGTNQLFPLLKYMINISI
jgi:hypothetical protein